MSISRTRNGQTAAEFIMMMGIAIVMTVVFLGSIVPLIASSAEEERLAAMNDVAYTIQDEVILATLVTDGYTRAFTIPQRAGRFTYELTTIDGAIMLTSGPITQTYPIPDVTGTFAKGTNIIEKDGTVTVGQ